MSIRDDVKSYAAILRSFKESDSVSTSLNESVQDEAEQLFVVTEGWDNDDMQSLLESEDYDYLSESIFGGAPRHVIDSIVHAGVKRGGEESSITTTTAKQKGHVYDHLKNTHEGEKNEANHTIVKHNGKVIASIHPKGEKGNIKFDAHSDKAKEPETKTKTAAYSHIYDAIDKAGGYKGHKVEIHSIRADTKRDDKEAKRKEGGHTNDTNKQKSFESIARRAAEKVTSKHIENLAKKHDAKVKAAKTRLKTHITKNGVDDVSTIAAHTDKIKQLEASHPSKNTDTQVAAGNVKHTAAAIGAEKDKKSTESSGKMRSRVSTYMKDLKNSDKPKPKKEYPSWNHGNKNWTND